MIINLALLILTFLNFSFQPENLRFEVCGSSSRTSWHAQWLSCCKNTSGWRPWYQERLVLKFPTGVEATALFKAFNASCWAVSQTHCTLVWVSSHNGLLILDKRGRNLLRYCPSPSCLCTPALSVGVGLSIIPRTLVGSTLKPWSVATCRMKGPSVCWRFSLSVLSLTPRSRNLTITLPWSVVASSIVPQLTMIKSSATTSIPVIPSTSSYILRWKFSGAELTPKGRCRNGNV